jgi:flagellar hook-associated protein 1 FlgK
MSAAIDIALSGLRSSQLAIDITAHNVANANVEGYSRQRPVAVTKLAQTSSQTFVGSGVDVQKVERLSDRWTAGHLRTEVAEQGYYDTLHERLSEVEAVFNETNTKGLGDALNTFFQSVAQLVDQPESPGHRAMVLANGDLLAARLRNADRQLRVIERDTRAQIASQVGVANQLLDQVALLNRQIVGAGGSRADTNGLQDQRDGLLRKLAETLGARTLIDEDNSAVVSVEGTSLVLGGDALLLSYGGSGFTIAENGQQIAVTKGQLGAMHEAVDQQNGILGQYVSDLDTMASTLIDRLNTLHSAGYGLDGSTGRDFFVGTNAGDIAVNPDLQAHPERFAASANGAAGNAEVARAIAGVRDEPLLPGGGTIDSYYEAVVGSIGVETAAAKAQSEGLNSVVDQIVTHSESLKGVSLDEEMTNLIRFQQAYNASGRVVQIVKEMTDALLALRW